MNYRNLYKSPSKRTTDILRTNIFTFFNFLNLLLAIAVFVTGEYKNMLFVGVIFLNTSIGIIQELRAKRVLDRLSLIHAAKFEVARGGGQCRLDISELLPGDVIILSEGQQIPADCEIAAGELEVNESLLTGEAEPVNKREGDELLSGSFIISGQARAHITKDAADSYAFSIMKEAKYPKRNPSQLRRSADRLLKALSVIIVPVAAGLFAKSIMYSEMTETPDFGIAVNTSAAAVIGMIPQGLILLISAVTAVSTVRLAKHCALAQDMYCAEILARTDVLCLDKTGTLTTGSMTLEEIVPVGDYSVPQAKQILSAMMAVLPDRNPTACAVRSACSDTPGWQAVSFTPFSSARRQSSVSFGNRGTFTLGAPSQIPSTYSHKRVLALSCGDTLIAYIIIGDEIRPQARETLAFFNNHEVTVKIISGDNVHAVKAAAQAAGVKNAESCIDMSGFGGDITEAAQTYSVFGRVTPHVKLELIKALKACGHTVAMVGDGVNDVLPLKEADCSIAMQSGSEAARNVSGLILLDNNLCVLPKAVAEGRRLINNLERSAVLFLSKTVYSLVLAFIFLFTVMPYPLIPIQLTIISGFFIGFPSVVLALEKNRAIQKGAFLPNVLRKAVPFGMCAVLAVSLSALFTDRLDFTDEQTGTASVIILGAVSFLILFGVCLPLSRRRLLLTASCGVMFMFFIKFFSGLLSLMPII